jgi:hypothetical protein
MHSGEVLERSDWTCVGNKYFYASPFRDRLKQLSVQCINILSIFIHSQEIDNNVTKESWMLLVLVLIFLAFHMWDTDSLPQQSLIIATHLKLQNNEIVPFYLPLREIPVCNVNTRNRL